MTELWQRKTNRLAGYDYSQAGDYYITICVKDKHEMLGKIIDGQSVLSEYGNAVKREIENISIIRKECMVKKYVVMPNHIHLIVQISLVGNDGNHSAEPDNHPSNEQATYGNRILESQTDIAESKAEVVEPRADCHPPLQQRRKSVSNMVQGLKGAVTRQIGFSLWQRSFHDHIIRDRKEYREIWNYIDANPKKWEKDCYYVRPIKHMTKPPS